MRVLLTGAAGMLGSSIATRWQEARPADELIPLTRDTGDLRDSDATERLFRELRPDLVIHAAAVVGGIQDKLANPLRYLQENLRLDTSVIGAAVASGTSRFVYVASAAAYPAAAPNPIAESELFNGGLEPANEGYGLAKLTGITAIRYAALQTGTTFRAVLPSNLYGPGDTFDPERSHLIASTLRKAHEAREHGDSHVEVWGDGTARREFTFAPDLAQWLADAVDRMEDWPLVMNVGAGVDHTIREYYEVAAEVTGFAGGLRFDAARPSGVPRRLIDSSAARSLGWTPKTPLRDGMAICYRSFLTHTANGDLR